MSIRALKTVSTFPESCLFALLFCGYPIVSFVPNFLPLPDRVASIGFRIACLLLSVWVIYRNWRSFTRNRIGLALLLSFWGIYLCRMIYDYQFVGIVGAVEYSDFATFTFGISFPTVLATFAIADWTKLKQAPALCMILTTSACAFAVKFGISNVQAEGVGRLVANERLNPILLGHTATTLIITAVWYLLARPADPHINVRGKPKVGSDRIVELLRRPFQSGKLAGVVVVVALGIYALLLSASRSPTVALLFCLSLLAIWLRFRVGYLIFLGTALALVFAQAGFLGDIARLGVNTDRITTLGLLSEDYNGRVDLFTEAWDKFLSSPLVGTGLFLDNGGYPHNMLLESLMACGVLGGTILLAIFLKALIQLIQASKGGNSLVFWMLLLFIQSVFGTMTSGSIFYDPMMWSTIGLGVGLLSIPRKFRTDEIHSRLQNSLSRRAAFGA